MKAKTFFFLAWVAIVTRVSQSAGQSNVVFYGTNTNAMGVVFMDTNLSASVKASIVADLQVCSIEWGKGELRLRNKGDSVGYIDNATRCPHYPENIEFPENVVSNGLGGLALQIPKKLSDAYTNAFAFAVANSNIVAAAYEFVAFVSSTNFYIVTSNQISSYCLYNQAPSLFYQLSFSEITNSVSQQSYYPPSILGFYYSPDGPNASDLWVRIPCTYPSHGSSVSWNFLPAIWHDGKWKFCIWEENPHYDLTQ